MRREWTERTEDYKDYSDYGESASGLSVDKKSLTDKEPIWHETGASTFFENVPWYYIAVVIILLAISWLVVICCIVYAYRRSRNNKKKKQLGIHGISNKKASYFRDRTSKPRNPAPVTNPDKGSHYLKKSPSPTGVKSPPGVSADDYIQRKALVTCGQQISGVALENGDYEIDEGDFNEGLARRDSTDLPVNPLGGGCGDQVLGTLNCTMKYSFDKNALIVTVNKCTNLPAKDLVAKTSDPYVKLQLLPEKQHKVKTRVMRKTLNPVYDEDFTFYGIMFTELSGLTLHFVVLSFDRYSRDDVIGEVMLELESIDLSASDTCPVPIAREITPRSYKLKSQGRGEILVSLCYQPAANRITVVVLKARNLPKMDITGLSDPYVKIYLLYNDQRIAKKKTHVKKRTLSPVFNESFVFELPHLEEGLKNISLEFMLLDWDRVTKNEVVGRLDLGGPKCTGTALNHWNEVVSSPRRQIAEWHKLNE